MPPQGASKEGNATLVAFPSSRSRQRDEPSFDFMARPFASRSCALQECRCPRLHLDPNGLAGRLPLRFIARFLPHWTRNQFVVP